MWMKMTLVIETMFLHILQPNQLVMKVLSWMIDIWTKKSLSK